jgi:serine/threonine protein kinase/Tol biopolymer transport system component
VKTTRAVGNVDLPPVIGTTVGSYEILSLLGEGGMGRVYRAHDRKLGRDVALKILPEAFARDADRLARFEREARTLASLNHPNIAQVYDAGRTDSGVVFLAMELVPGDDLAARLRGGPINLDTAIAIAKQIASALEAAHDQGIVHRDLKPANIKVRDDGTVKVLDFGLAKSTVADSSATMTSPAMTEAGIILGTAAYMSPEQAKGRVVDKRADIWAFGVVLREMLTGRSLFAGESVAETLGKVLHEPIGEQNLPPLTPRAVRQLIARCLDRDPSTRLRDIGEARIALSRVNEPGADGPPDPRPGTTRGRVPFPAIAAGIALMALAGLAGWMLKPAPQSTEQTRKLDIITKNLVANLNPNSAPILSPDGRRLLYFADGKLRVRSMDKLEPDELAGTEGAGYYAWSPDSRRVAYVAKEQVWIQDVGGAAPTAIGPAPAGLAGAGGLAWNSANEIAAAGSPEAGVTIYSTKGGVPRTLIALDKKKESDFHEISALPSAGGWLVAIHRSQGSDTIAAVVNGVRKDILTIVGETLRSPVYVEAGFLLFQRARNNVGLVAVPFSLDRLEMTGEPFMVVPGAWQPSVTADGTELAFVRKPDVAKHFVWVNRTGNVEWAARDSLPIAVDDTDQSFDLSPDGRTVAFTTFESGPSDLWTYDLERGTKARLTGQGGVAAGVYAPIWTRDARRVLFAAFLGQVYWNIYGRAADLSGDIETVVNDGDFVLPFCVSADNQWLVYGKGTNAATAKLMVRRLDGSDAPRVLVSTGVAPMGRAALSPDGHWFAYTANESGTDEIIVRRFPSGEGRWPISSGGGTFAAWTKDGSELIYRSRDRIMSAPVKRTATTFEVVSSTPLFTANADNGLASAFQLSHDGKRLLMVRTTGEDRITVILNFPAELQRLQQAK